MMVKWALSLRGDFPPLVVRIYQTLMDSQRIPFKTATQHVNEMVADVSSSRAAVLKRGGPQYSDTKEVSHISRTEPRSV